MVTNFLCTYLSVLPNFLYLEKTRWLLVQAENYLVVIL